MFLTLVSQVVLPAEGRASEVWKKWLSDWKAGFDLEQIAETGIYLSFDFCLVFLLGFIAFRLTDRVLLRALNRIFRKTKNTFDDLLVERNVMRPLSYFIPMMLAWWLIPYVFGDFERLNVVLVSLAKSFAVIALMAFFRRFLNALEDALEQVRSLRDKPVHSYIQLASILNYVLSTIVVVSVLTQMDVAKILTALSALTAVLILVFKDTLLGFVSSLQISANDMIRVGDWITVKDYGADGTVLRITLNVVKVQNFDNTISMVPTYAFISHSFQNWRGMGDSGVRRIKRALNLNMSSVKFVDLSFCDALYGRLDGLGLHNDFKMDAGSLEGLTNVSLFRKYALEYLKGRQDISDKSTTMVRQLQSTAEGLPLEIYAFTTTTDWVAYEGIQSEVFDHLIAVAPYFDLEVFQAVAGHDLTRIGKA